jgi:cellulose synthase/poly-beta-1,6-N-acetylglucosamine synthase-like glycosyltransferase
MEWLLLIFVMPYVYFLLKIFLQLKKILPYSAFAKSPGYISVIIPCHNEEEYLPRLLKLIEDQDYDYDLFEVIVVDDNSCDSTPALAAGFTGIKNFRVLNNTGRGKKQAIMTGVSASQGNYIITTDADCMPGRKWISTIAAFLQDKMPDIVICPVMMESKTGFFNRFQELEFISLQGITAGTAVSGKPVMCNGANLVFRKETYLMNAKSLHNEIPSGDDVFLLHALKKNTGAKISWLESADAITETSLSGTLREYINQRNRWISKFRAYRDRDTIVLGLVIFTLILVQFVALITGIFNKEFLAVFGVIFLLKSIPDFLILRNTTIRYGKSYLMKWFFPCELIYPFYVASVLIKSVFRSDSWEKKRY